MPGDAVPEAGLKLSGFLGDSDRPGHRRLYFTAALDYYVEFMTDDVVTTAGIPTEMSPLPGFEAMQIVLRKNAVVSYTCTSPVRPPDEFDIDVRRIPGRLSSPSRAAAETEVPADCGFFTHEFETCVSCENCGPSVDITRCDSCAPTCETNCSCGCQETEGCHHESDIEGACTEFLHPCFQPPPTLNC